MRPINRIIVHCAATRPEWMDGQPLAAKVEEIRRWHTQQNGWADIGYHWIIDRDGQIAPGRQEATPGAHVKGHNADSIGVCLIGGHGAEPDDGFASHFTAAQDAALRRLIDGIQERHPGATVHGHNEYAAKGCPGFRAAAWHAQKPARGKMQSKTLQASTVQAAAGAAGAITAGVGGLHGTAQIIAIAGGVLIVALALFIMRERLRAWAAGWR